jgi:hypothetical protein
MSTVAFLAGPDARWITGQNVRAIGGLLLQTVSIQVAAIDEWLPAHRGTA